MSLSHSPKIATDGLVFYYDMGNLQKSWKGSPITNLVNPVWSNWSVDGSGQGSIGTRTITSPYECTIVDNTANTRQSISISSGITAGTTYTFSVQYKKISGTPTLRFQIQAYNSATYLSTISFAITSQLGILDINDWQTAKITVTTPANTNRILWFMQDGDDYATYSHSFSLKNVQCEQNSFATPFVDGTRSNTQAIVDLTGRNTVAANSLTYNSNGSFKFANASQNYLSFPYTQSSPNDFTVEAWIYHTAHSSDTNIGHTIVIPYSNYNAWIFSLNGTDSKLQLRHHNFTLSSTAYNILYSTGLLLNTWYHVAATDNGTTVTLYVNGQAVTSSASSVATTNGTMDCRIGSWPTSGTSFDGDIASVKIYNRGLSAAEVQLNFNAQRGRYGL
jgi:hypothetical protein